MEPKDDDENDDSFESRQKVRNEVYYVTPLHDHPELLDECCILINMEWKRSLVARSRSIGGSSDKFPTSLILMKDSRKPMIVGHCKLNKISHSCPVIFVDTVVIHPDFRGRGLGKFLMHKAEQYLKRKGIEWIYLTTMGQELFYDKLGYSVCEPINIYGGQLNLDSYNTDQEIASGRVSCGEHQNMCEENINMINEVASGGDLKSEGLVPTPGPVQMKQHASSTIPPPPPMPSFQPKVTKISSSNKTFMRKRII